MNLIGKWLSFLIPLSLFLIRLNLGDAVLPITTGVPMGVSLHCRVRRTLYFRDAAFCALVGLLPLLLLNLAFDVVEVVLAHVCVQVVAGLPAEDVPAV